MPPCMEMGSGKHSTLVKNFIADWITIYYREVYILANQKPSPKRMKNIE